MKKKWQLLGVATTANLLLFMLFLVFTHPIYDTNEDVQILYLLSGGFGNAPTSLLHYNHIVHPCLAIVLKDLFLLNDNINWYTVALLVFHFTACTIIFFQLLQKNKTFPFILYYLLIITVFEYRFLLTLNFTNTAIVTGLSGLVLLFTAEQQRSLSVRRVIAGCLVILVASFWRIHVLIPVIGIVLPFFLLFSSKNTAIIAVALIVTAGLVISFNYLHQLYYKSNVAGWQQEDDYRQKIYRFYNNNTLHQPGPNEKWYTEYNLIKNGLPVDTAFLSRARVTNMLNDLKENNDHAVKNTEEKNWVWINNRIFFFTILLLLASFTFSKRGFVSATGSLVLIIAGLVCLLLFFKLSNYLLFACLFSYSVFILLSGTPRWLNKSYANYISIFFSISLLFWGIVRIYKLNQTQVEQIRQFKLAYSEIALKKDKLFIVTADKFPLQKFYIFDVPKRFSLPNFVNNEHFLLNIYKPVFDRFQIREVKELPSHPTVLFWGNYVPALENYFYWATGNKASFSQPLHSFKFGKVYTVTDRQANPF